MGQDLELHSFLASWAPSLIHTKISQLGTDTGLSGLWYLSSLFFFPGSPKIHFLKTVKNKQAATSTPSQKDVEILQADFTSVCLKREK